MTQIDGILIDNDIWVRSFWEQRCKEAGKSIKTFASVEQFMQVFCQPGVDRKVPIFIDSRLNDERGLGEEQARDIYAEGFRNIYLATSMPPHNRDDYPHLRGYVSKEPPSWFINSGDAIAKVRQYLLDSMSCEQRRTFEVRLKELEAAKNGASSDAWPVSDGSGAYWPQGVLDAWEAALYYSPSDDQLEAAIHDAWLETLE